MNTLYILNHVVFSVFMTLLLVEGGFAITALVAYEKYKERLMSYITPIWEVTGTFAVFYVVNFEATFPKLLGVVGTLYALPLLVAAALIILRNVFLIHGEYQGDVGREARYLKIYALSTVVALVILLSVLSSAITGAGINTTAVTASLAMYLNPFNLIAIASALLVSLSLAIGIFRIGNLDRLGWLPLALAFALFYIGIAAFAPSLSANLGAFVGFIAAFVILVAVLGILQARSWKHSGKLSVFAVLFAIGLVGMIEYPYIFGSADINAYLNSSALAGPIVTITLVGGSIVAASLAYLIYISYLRRGAYED
ncbi:MAG: cytochrome d ubiquinol oxidase subunit II [Candidatus Micrarchaeota archaeon]|nr:cytochrome d ubiquinol oxidase subunit II [Candidatus Micrarchaeota archaeon]